MYQIQYLNKISKAGTERFTDNYTVGEEVQNPDAIMVRSANMLEMELPQKLLAIARAGAGVNNIPLDKCSEKGIVVFNTPGANANAVKELVLCGLFLSSRRIVPAAEWCKTLKGKGAEVPKLIRSEKGSLGLLAPKSKGKHSESLGWVQSVFWLPMLQSRWEWKSMAMTLIFR